MTPPADPEGFDDLLDLVGGLDRFIPPAFHAVFRLARVLFSNERALDPRLRGTLEAVQGATQTTQQVVQNEGGLVGHSYKRHPERRRIRGPEELYLVDTIDQLLHPPAELMRLSEAGELRITDFKGRSDSQLVPRPTDLKDGGKSGALSEHEQKFYVLLDQSYSMRNDHRLVFAQTLLLWFIRQKYQGGARPQLFFRGFAAYVGPLKHAADLDEVAGITRAILTARPDQKGTDIQAALVQAISDIRYHSLATVDAQILLITDGLGVIDVARIQELSQGQIKIHLVQIGADEVAPVGTQVQEIATKLGVDPSNPADARRIQRWFAQQIEDQFDLLCETRIQLPDLQPQDLEACPSEIDEIERVAESRVLTIDAQGPDGEAAHRMAAFLSQLLEMMRRHASPEDADRIDRVIARLVGWIGRRLDPARIAELLAQQDISLIFETGFKKAASTGGINLSKDPRLALAFRLWKRRGGQGGLPIARWRIWLALARSVLGRGARDRKQKRRRTDRAR